MSLRLRELTFRNFRNYDYIHLDEIAPVTVFIGENAVGKTNIIEGIELLTSFRSFRHASPKQLIQDGFEESLLNAHIADEYRSLLIELSISENHKAYKLNGKKKRASQLKGTLPSVVFTPDDLMLVKGSQSIRRAEYDSLGSQLSENYGVIRRDYESVLRHKNKLLKEDAPGTLIDAIDEMIITCAAQLTCYRSGLLSKFAPYIIDHYEELSSSREKLTVSFTPSWEKDECSGIEKYEPSYARERIAAVLDERREEERQRKHCVVGSHLDTIHYHLDGKDATIFGSQGQQRTITLAYRLAELSILEDMLQQRPILLLDDVMSELDDKRRFELMKYIPNNTQAFITTTTLAYFDPSLLQDIHPIYLPLEQEGDRR